jgi:hypothetical protein
MCVLEFLIPMQKLHIDTRLNPHLKELEKEI